MLFPRNTAYSQNSRRTILQLVHPSVLVVLIGLLLLGIFSVSQSDYVVLAQDQSNQITPHQTQDNLHWLGDQIGSIFKVQLHWQVYAQNGNSNPQPQQNIFQKIWSFITAPFNSSTSQNKNSQPPRALSSQLNQASPTSVPTAAPNPDTTALSQRVSNLEVSVSQLQNTNQPNSSGNTSSTTPIRISSLSAGVSYVDLIGNSILDSFGNIYPSNSAKSATTKPTLGTNSNRYNGLYINGFIVPPGGLVSGGVVHADTTETLSIAKVSLIGEISDTLGTGNGGTGQSTYSTGDVLYSNATNSLARLAIGSVNQVLTIVGGVPTWQTSSASTCPTCVVTNPSAAQTITAASSTTGLSVAQAATAGSADVFSVTNNAASTKFLSINSSGNTVLSGTLTGATGLTSSGTITFSGLSTNGPVFTSAGGVLNSEALLAASRGGTGVNGSSAANGSLLIGNGSGYTLATLTAGSGVTVTNGSGSITIATSGASCTTCLFQVPGTTAQNTVTPTAASVVGLTVNATSSTVANAANFNQSQGGADAVDINLTNTSGTVTNGLLVNVNGAGGTTTNGINITQAAGTATNGLSFNGTFTNLINATNLTVTNGGNVTQGGNQTFSGTTARTITGPSTGGLTMTVASGPLTLSTTTSGTLAVTSAGALNLTGAAASTWDIGANTLSLQTVGNGAITTGTGLLTASGALTIGAGNLTFSGTTARSIVGPGTGGLTVSVAAGPLTLTTTTSGTLAVTSAGALNLTGAAASTWDIGANTLSLQTVGNGAITTGTGLLTVGGNQTFSGTTARTITGPSTGGLTMTVASGPLTLSTTTSGTLAVTSAGALNLTGAAASTWDIGANTLSLQTVGNGAITTGTGLLTQGGNITFSGTTARTITGPTTGGLTATVASGPLTLSTTTSGTLAVTSAGALNLTGAAASTWDIGANTLSLQTVGNGAITTGTGLLTVGGNQTFSGTTARTITGPGTGGLTVTVAAGPVTLSTTTSGTLAVTSAGALNLTSAANSTWDLTSGTQGNNTIVKVPRNTGGQGACATAQTAGIVFQTTANVQVSHLCIANAADQATWFAQAFTTASTDVAEHYSDLENSLEAGDVVSVNTSAQKGVVKSTGSYDRLLLGVVSTAPGILLSDISENNGKTDLVHPKPVALSGRVPVKVSTENGTINAGDYLTSSSTPGVAMKATKAGAVVGKSLASYNGGGVGKILVFVSATYADPTTLALSDTPKLNQSNVLGAATVQNSIDNTVLASLTTSGALTVNGQAEFKGHTLFDTLAEFVGNVVFRNDVSFLGRPTFNKDTAGLATIKQGADSVNISFAQAYDQNPFVNVTPTLYQGNDGAGQSLLSGELRFVVQNLSSNGFVIKLNKAASSDISFSWTALAVRDASKVSSTEAAPSTSPASSTAPTATSVPSPVSSPTAMPSPTVSPSPTAVPTLNLVTPQASTGAQTR